MKTASLKVMMLAPRQFTSRVLILTCVLLISATAMAQTPAPPQQPAQQSTVRPVPDSPPIPRRTIGLDPDKIVRWTMHDAILAALENNVDMEIERTNVRMAQYSVLEAQGIYDPTTYSGVDYRTQAQPNVFQFSGAGNDNTQSQSIYGYNAGAQQLIEKTGGSFQVDFNNNRLSSNFQNLAVNYNPTLVFQITQPLFRNFKIDQNRNTIKLMKKRLDISDATFRQRAIDIISRVQQAYWALYVAIQNEDIARSSLVLAEKQMNDNKRQVEVGTLAPISITEAATVVEQRRAAVFDAMNQVAQAENTLKVLTVDSPNSDLWKSRIDTIDKFQVQDNLLPLDDAMRLAMDNRPEIKILGLQREIYQNDVQFFRNQAKPQINFIAGYTLEGVGGTARPQLNSNCSRSSAVVVGGQLSCLGLGLVNDSPGITNVPYQETIISPIDPASGFLGGYGTSLRNLFSNDFRSWNVGFRFSLPLRNRQAKARLAIARENEKNTELQIRQQLQNVEVEVRNAVQAVETAKQRIDSTRKQREFAQDQLDGENKRFQAGLSTTFFVLQYQNALTNAQVSENNAIADYNQATATLQRVIATTLSSNNVELVDPKQPMK